MKRILLNIILSFSLFLIVACHNKSQTIQEEKNNQTTIEKGENQNLMKIKITVQNTVLYAEFESNATTRALVEQMPLTLTMTNLYNREMCYRYGVNALPTDYLRDDGYEIGDIAYWPPRGSLVILYEQNGEQFEHQHIGHIETGVDIFKTLNDTDITFEIADE